MKWAGFKGNLSAILVLSDGPQSTGLFYAWDISQINTSGNTVCASNESNFDWSTIVEITIADLEANLTAWDADYDDGADSVSNTFDAG